MSKKYSKESLLNAMNSELGSKRAADMFNVPASTIRRHRRNQNIQPRVGRPSYLSETEEAFFTSLLELLPEFSFQITTNVALKLAQDYFESLGLSMAPGKKWLYSFVERHSEKIKWQKEVKLERAREEAFTEDCRRGWFGTLEEVLKKHDLFDKPNQIFNVDETGFCDRTKGQWVIVKSSRRHVFEKYGGSGKNHRTAVIGVSAGGFVLSPLFIYRGKNLMNSWRVGGPSGAHYGVTETGWTNTLMFEYWIESIFIPSTAHLARPLLLIFDGYSSHISLKIINLLKENTIICVMLPSHTTHALQPVDIVLFSSVKNDWCNIVKNHFKDGNKTIKNSDFPRLMKKLFIEKKSFSQTRIVSSFARSGIWPFDKQAMRDKVATKAINSSTITTDECLEPTNLLLPTLSSVNNLLNLSTTSLMNILPSSDCSFSTSIFNLSANAFNEDELIPQTIVNSTIEPNIVYYDMSSQLPVQNRSFTDLQPCSTQYPSEEPYRSEYATSSTEDHTNTTTDGELIPKPIDAIRHVLEEILLTREQVNPITTTTTSQKTTRDTRLKSSIGLNITENENVIMKLKEKETKKKEEEEKRTRKRKSSIEDNSFISKRTPNRGDSRRKRSTVVKEKDKNKENQQINDIQIHSHIQLLDTVLEYTEDVQYTQTTHEDYSTF